MKLYSTINYTEDGNKKKIEEDIVFNSKNLILKTLLDVIENFAYGKEKPLVTKTKLSVENFAFLIIRILELFTLEIFNCLKK